MNRFVFALGGAAVVLVAAVLVVGLYGNNPPSGVGGPGTAVTSPSLTTRQDASPSADATPRADPSSAPEPSLAGATSAPGGGLPEGAFTVTQLVAGAPTITVTIPAPGWRSLPQFEAIEKGTEVANLPEATILFWAFLAGTEFYVPEDPCQAQSTRPEEPATSVDQIVAALAVQASRNASEPENVTIGGFQGKSITLHVPDDAAPDACELGEFVSFGINEDPLARHHQGPGQIDQFWFLDVDGTTVMIDAAYRPDTGDELVEEMRTIAASATFETP